MRTSSAFCSGFVAAIFLAASLIGVCQRPPGYSIRGTVVDSAHAPVAAAKVHIERDHQVVTGDAISGPDGTFVFEGLAASTYIVAAQRDGVSSRGVQVGITDQDAMSITLVLDQNESAGATNPSAQAMEFADNPNFTIAGVTDWTAAGGHGSDVSLRTSEALNRETLNLQPESPGIVAGGSARTAELESRLRKALAAAPANFDANRQLGALYLRQGMYREALPLLQKAYEANGTDTAIYTDLALSL